ncbi:hypothetical protein D1872_224310 [compost metagenome]
MALGDLHCVFLSLCRDGNEFCQFPAVSDDRESGNGQGHGGFKRHGILDRDDGGTVVRRGDCGENIV